MDDALLVRRFERFADAVRKSLERPRREERRAGDAPRAHA